MKQIYALILCYKILIKITWDLVIFYLIIKEKRETKPPKIKHKYILRTGKILYVLNQTLTNLFLVALQKTSSYVYINSFISYFILCETLFVPNRYEFKKMYYKCYVLVFLKYFQLLIYIYKAYFGFINSSYLYFTISLYMNM